MRISSQISCHTLLPLLAATPRPSAVAETLRPRIAALRASEEDQPATATLSFRKNGVPEEVVPNVALTRSRDGSTGTATFRFDSPSVIELHNVWDDGLITGLWVEDEEGTLTTQDLKVTFEQVRLANPLTSSTFLPLPWLGRLAASSVFTRLYVAGTTKISRGDPRPQEQRRVGALPALHGTILSIKRVVL
tara:strand:+ start:424 stop:996 length:573 start_codon:yes stop_codon:yes gene_type:complete